MMTLRQGTEGDLTKDELVENPLVEVREYLRLRYSHWETVREHMRKRPRRKRGQSGNE
jgi:hypothetical protein